MKDETEKKYEHKKEKKKKTSIPVWILKPAIGEILDQGSI
jgi:hypothetical protein